MRTRGYPARRPCRLSGEWTTTPSPWRSLRRPRTCSIGLVPARLSRARITAPVSGHSHERQLAGAGQRQSKGRQITRRLPDDSPVLLARVAQSVERVFEKHETAVRLHSPIANQKDSWGINFERRQADLPKPNEWLLRNIGFCPGRWTGVQTHVPHETNHNQRSSPEGVSGDLEIMGVDAHGKQRHGGANQCPRSPP